MLSSSIQHEARKKSACQRRARRVDYFPSSFDLEFNMIVASPSCVTLPAFFLSFAFENQVWCMLFTCFIKMIPSRLLSFILLLSSFSFSLFSPRVAESPLGDQENSLTTRMRKMTVFKDDGFNKFLLTEKSISLPSNPSNPSSICCI